MKTIIVAEFHQETNSFNPLITTRKDFERRQVSLGNQMLETGQKLELAGMVQAIMESDGKVVPACAMKAPSGGLVDQEIVDDFISQMKSTIRSNMPIDGVFLSLHGATQTADWEDACGIILETARKEVGSKAVIVTSADLHANVTPRWMENADIICGYRSYPHVDHFETGYRAAGLGMLVLHGQKLHMARVSVPMLIPANLYTSLASPFQEVIEDARELVRSKTLRDCSVFQMQPWLDVSCASGAVVIAIDEDRDKAEFHAVRLAKHLYDVRKEFRADLFTIDQVIDIALKDQSRKPVLLVDAADSSNAGSTGDSAAILERLLQRDIKPRTALIINDAPAVALAFQTGIGNKAEFRFGGTRNPDLFAPVTAEGYVKSLHDGVFRLESSAYRGHRIEIGLTAVVTVGEIDIVLCHAMMMNGDPQIYRGFGIEPNFYQMVVVKACTSFREAYGPITDRICLTDTPGAASANLKSLPFRKVLGNFYPFSNLDDYQIRKI
jgi:microcystin degradation protein MlrC